MVQIELITKQTQLLVVNCFIFTFSIPPREVTSTKSRCRSSSLPPMMGILQLKFAKRKQRNINDGTENVLDE